MPTAELPAVSLNGWWGPIWCAPALLTARQYESQIASDVLICFGQYRKEDVVSNYGLMPSATTSLHIAWRKDS